MAEFTWEADVASGVLKNNSLSSKVREAAIAQTRIVPFCYPEPGYGKRAGDSHTITLIKNIAEPTSAQLSETTRVPIDTYAQASTTITVQEYGRGVEYTHKSELLSHYDLEDRMQRKLRQQLQLVLDTAAATAFKACQIKFIPTSLSGGTFDTDGTASTSASQNLTVAHVKTIRDYLSDTIHCPTYDGDDYICLASTKALRGIRNDPEFLEWMKGDKSHVEEGFFKAWAGRIENIRFVEVNHTNALANNKGTGSVLGEALFFGEDAVALVVAEDPELRAAIPSDFGRQKAVAWYGVLQFAALWTTSNDGEARIVHVTSS